jgi:hypothetical protein
MDLSSLTRDAKMHIAVLPVIVARRMEGGVQVIIDVQVIEPLGQTG